MPLICEGIPPAACEGIPPVVGFKGELLLAPVKEEAVGRDESVVSVGSGAKETVLADDDFARAAGAAKTGSEIGAEEVTNCDVRVGAAVTSDLGAPPTPADATWPVEGGTLPQTREEVSAPLDIASVELEAVDATTERVVGAAFEPLGCCWELKRGEDEEETPSVSSSASRNAFSLAAVASRSFFKSSWVTV